MTALALGTKVFVRTEKLRRLLESAADSPVSKVYVADDGDTDERRHLYERDWPFELELLDLEFDAGLGRGRREIAERFREEYLLIVDSDHRIPDNVDVLVDQLRTEPDLGGVAGLFLENGILTGMCHDLVERGDVLVRDTPSEKDVRTVAGHPLIEFDFVPNAAVFRRECLADYAWDPEYVIGKEHLDFYVGHERRTDWRFAACPRVLFPHDPGGDATFTRFRTSEKQRMRSKRYFLDKWGYRQIVRERYWLDLAHGDPTMVRLNRALPWVLRPTVADANDWLRTVKGHLAGYR